MVRKTKKQVYDKEYNKQFTTIRVSKELRDFLNTKIEVKGEGYSDIIWRLIKKK